MISIGKRGAVAVALALAVVAVPASSAHAAVEWAASATDATSVAREAVRLRPDIVLMDLQLPMMSGVAMVSNFKFRIFPASPS